MPFMLAFNRSRTNLTIIYLFHPKNPVAYYHLQNGESLVSPIFALQVSLYGLYTSFESLLSSDIHVSPR